MIQSAILNSIRIQSELVEGVRPKAFEPRGRHHYYLRILIEGEPSDLDQIELVKYTLDPTFKDRYRVSTDRSRNFDVRIWTYGYFPVSATVFLKSGGKQELSGEVKWKIPKGLQFDDV